MMVIRVMVMACYGSSGYGLSRSVYGQYCTRQRDRGFRILYTAIIIYTDILSAFPAVYPNSDPIIAAKSHWSLLWCDIVM